MNLEDYLPHRPPFLLLDKLLTVIPGIEASGSKVWQADDPLFQGHFPGEPVVPGVLLLESLAQVGAVAVLSAKEYQGKKAYLVKILEVKFNKMVRPEEEVVLNCQVKMLKAGFGEGVGEALVKGQIVMTGKIIFKVI